MNLVAFAVKEASQQDSDDEQKREDDTPACCEAARMFVCAGRVVRFSHLRKITCVGVMVRMARVSYLYSDKTAR